MPLRSFAKLYALAEAGNTDGLLIHIAELQKEFPEDTDPPNLALLAAAEANQLETVHALLKAGANVEGALTTRPYIHPLWKAAKRGHLRIVQLLVNSGANMDATDNRGMTALDYARRYSRSEVVEYLESFK